MKLSDVMGRSGLVSFAEIALLLFIAAFIGIVIYTFMKRNREKYERARHMPLEDDEPIDPRPASGRGSSGRGDAR